MKTNKKKWERLIVNTYKINIKFDSSELNNKLSEKFTSEEEVKNILTELKIKIKDLEYLFKKQWQILKKFNLQERIYREESKNLVEREKSKKDEIYTEAIEKLTAAHVGGFEPASVIKNKILTKIQQKFDVPDLIMEELRNINFNLHFKKDARENLTDYKSEENLLKKRHEDQVTVLENFIQNLLIPAKDSKYKEKDYDCPLNFHQNKQELKRYEKELEMKAGKGGLNYIPLEEEFLNNFDTNISSTKKISDNEKGFSLGDKKEFEKISNEVFSSFNPFSPEINEAQSLTKSSERYDNHLKVKDFLKVNDLDSITKFKEKVIENIRNKTTDKLKKQEFKYLSPYKSKILNDLYVRL
jgi:hypothetical protein